MSKHASNLNPSSRFAKALLALASTGLIVSWIQTVHFFQNRKAEGAFKSFCTFGAFDCDKVEASRWADFIVPGIPVSAFAAGFFLGLGLLAVPLWSGEKISRALLPLRVLTTVAALFSLFLLWVMMTQLQTWCLLCLIVDATVLALCALTWLTPQREKSPALWGTALKLLAAGTAVAFVGAWLMKSPNEEPALRAALVQGTLQSAPLAVTTEASYPQIGPAQAPITIVKFSDFQCPHCKKGALTVHQLMNRFPGKIRFVFRNFPLDAGCNRMVKQPMHDTACEAARVAVCATKQGKFEPVYEAIFEAQKDLVPGLPIQLAIKNGMDETALRACVDQPETIAAVQRDVEEGISLGIQGTPTFFINQKRVNGFPDLDTWAQLVTGAMAPASR